MSDLFPDDKFEQPFTPDRLAHRVDVLRQRCWRRQPPDPGRRVPTDELVRPANWTKRIWRTCQALGERAVARLPLSLFLGQPGRAHAGSAERAAIFAVDDAGRHLGPGQHGRRSDLLLAAGRRRRRQAAARHDLLHEERRRAQHDPPRLLRQRRRPDQPARRPGPRAGQARFPTAAPDVMGLMAGVADVRFRGHTQHHSARCDLRASHQRRRHDGQQRLANAAHRVPAIRRRRRERHRHRAARHSSQVSAALAQLHYARGCSLAESFYQSISGPYQLLIVGDPLCQPWAVLPTDQGRRNHVGRRSERHGHACAAWRPPEPVIACRQRSNCMSTADWSPRESHRARRSRSTPPSWPTAITSCGSSACRRTRSKPRGESSCRFGVNNHDAAAGIHDCRPGQSGRHRENSRVSVRQPGATAIAIRQNSREVARVQGEAGDVEIEAATLGRGPTTLQAVSEGATPAVSRPLSIRIE